MRKPLLEATRLCSNKIQQYLVIDYRVLSHLLGRDKFEVVHVCAQRHARTNCLRRNHDCRSRLADSLTSQWSHQRMWNGTQPTEPGIFRRGLPLALSL
eukprot:6477518-Amphidinium_carterae.1